MRTPLFVCRIRKLPRRPNLALVASSPGIAFATAAGVALLLDERGTSSKDTGSRARPSAVQAQKSDPAPPSGKLAARMEAAAIAEIRQQPQADLSSLPAFELPPPLVSIDGTGFRRGEETIRLDGVVGPRAGDVCLDGLRWSCGLQARAALHNLVAGRSMSCQPRRALANAVMSADCRLEGKDASPDEDVARLLVQQGWARPAAGREADFAAELDQARAANAGLWRGGWVISRP